MNNISETAKAATNITPNAATTATTPSTPRAQDDFFLFANHDWMATHPIPGDQSRYGVFDELRELTKRQVRELITGLADDPESKVKGSIAQKVSDLYALGMDEERLNREGAAPLMPYINRINEAKPEELTNLIAWMHMGLSSVFFATGVGPDSKQTTSNIFIIGEAGLSLGDRDYYLEKSEANDKVMKAFEVYVKRLMELIGYDAAAQERVWQTVIKIETEIARNVMPREMRRDPMATYNIRTLSEIKSAWGAIDWDAYLKAIGVGSIEKADVSSPKYFDWLTSFLPSLSWQEIQDLMVYEATAESTGVLSDDFSEAAFELYGRVMSGTTEQTPRWKRAMSLPNSMLGEAVGELYVKKHFPPANKERMLTLVGNLRKGLRRHIKDLPWMSASTKEKALEKLEAFGVKIGYPDKWKDYSGIDIDPLKSYQENVLAAATWYINDNYSKLHEPVDKQKWHMTPQTVNAYYSPLNNEICFPAAILQPPFFNPEASDAENYGAIGCVIGHEMTHGFDDQGRQFDKNGNLDNWWTPADEDAFKALADKLVAQFDAIEVAPGVHANGRFTLGENIADQGGLRVALTAFLSSNPDYEKLDEQKRLDLLRSFYLAYAKVWAGNIREESIPDRTKTDPHSLSKWRVDATLRNILPFYEAYDVKEGDGMWLNPEERVVIW